MLETGADVEELADLDAPWPNYRPVRWVLAVKEDSPFRERAGSRRASASPPRPSASRRRYLKPHGVTAEVEFSWGATEVKPPVLADAIVDVTETGSSSAPTSSRVIDTVLESTPRFIANREAYAGRLEARQDGAPADAAARRDRGRAAGSAS